MIEVVSAVIIRDDRVLLTQRRPDREYPLYWETPGGKVDLDETYGAALHRELHEELKLVVVHQRKLLWSGEFHPPKVARSFKCSMYRVETLETPVPQEGQGIGWFTVDEMRGLKLTPANEAASGDIIRALTSVSHVLSGEL